MAVFDGVRYSLSPSLSPTRRNELAAILDLNGAASLTPHTHLISPPASHPPNNARADIKLVTDRWVDRSVVMGKRQPEQYYSPDPAMIFSGVVACATDLSAADLEVLSAGITALGGQWRTGLTRDVTHLFALRTGSDKYNTALHFAPQTHMYILTPHWFDDSVRLGRRIPEEPYAWPDPPVLRPGLVLDLDKESLAPDGRRKRKPDAEADPINQGEHVRVWSGRRILLSASLELSNGSRRAIEAGIQRAGGLLVPISDAADGVEEEKAVDNADVLITRWRSGKSYFKAARASLLIGTLSWLFSVESSGTLHSSLDSLLWYPTPKGGIPDLIGCEISVTNYTGAARDYLKRLITLVGAKFTPSMSQSNKVLVAGFQPSPKTTRALSWSIPVVNHTWLEDCIVEWRALTVGLERYIVYPPGIDFGKMLMTRPNGSPPPQSVPIPRSNGGALPGGRGIGVIDIEQEEVRDAEYRARVQMGEPALDALAMDEAYANDTTDGISLVMDGDVQTETRAGPLKKTPLSSRQRLSTLTSVTASATGAFIDQIIELPSDDGEGHTNRQRAQASPRARVSKTPSARLPQTESKALAGTSSKEKAKERTSTIKDTEKRRVSPPTRTAKDVRTAQTNDEDNAEMQVPAQSGKQRRLVKGTTIDSEPELHSDAGEASEASVPPRRPTSVGSKTPIKSGMKPRPRSKSRSRPGSVLGGESGDEMVAGVAKKTAEIGKRREEPTKLKHAPQAKGKDRAREVQSGGEKGKARSRPSTRSPSPAPTTKKSHLPKRRLSVLVPSMPQDYFSSQSVRGGDDENRERECEKEAVHASASGSISKRVAPAGSMRAVAAEASTSSSKRGKPSPTRAVLEKSKTQPKVKHKSGAPKEMSKARDEDDEEDGDDIIMMVESPVISSSRGGPKRGAASKATTRLKEVVMPDVISFEKEQKLAKRRRSTGGESVVSVMEGDESEKEKRGGKRRKVVKEREVEEDEEAEVEDAVSVPSAKARQKPVNGKSKTKVTATVNSDEDMNGPVKKKLSGPQERNSARGRGKELITIRLMTTGVTLLDDVVKRISKLGVQMTTKPTDCTHLIAKGFVRTEKFLCAMSVSPYVLSEGWAIASAKTGKLLGEDDYLLFDEAAEQKWEFKFTEAMTRSRGPKGGSNLFKQMTFYVTPKVSVDPKLLKNVITAGGGQVQVSVTPTVRILKGKGNRYVVSCPEDKAIWRPLAQEGFKVYSPELVLRGALRQEIEWERKDCLVAG